MNRSMWTIASLGLLSCLAAFALAGQAPDHKAAPTSRQPSTEKPADAARIDELIRQLGSDAFTAREAASKALDTIGEPALPALRKAKDNPDLEVRHRVAEVLKSLKRKRSAARAKAWDIVKKKWRCHIDSDTGTPDGKIGTIEFNDAKLRDENLAPLEWLDEAEGLRLSGPQITDASLVHLKKFYRLRILDLESTGLTGAGLVHLKDLDRLCYLGLCGTQVADAGLVHLKGLKSLWHLDLGGTRITDAGLDHVKEIKSLVGTLNLSHTRVTDAGLAKLKGMSLYRLALSHTQITDAGLAHLKDVKNLHDLDLSETRITDAGLAHLKTIRTLTRLWLEDTKVTKKGMDDLKKSLPKLAFVGRTPRS